LPGYIPGEDEGAGPQHAAGSVVGQEGAVGHPRRARDRRHERAQHTDEPADEHGASSATADVVLRLLPALLADAAAPQRAPEAPPDLIAQRVAHDSSCAGRRDHHAEFGVAVGSKHAAEQHRRFAGMMRPTKAAASSPASTPRSR
jgi:hypothetical protein